MLDEYQRKAPNYNVVILNPSEAAKRGIELKPETISLNGINSTIRRAKWHRCNKITFIDTLEGETHHVLFAAFDLVLTRAGGGTVNNAIAFRVPLILVEEPGMWQVEQIRRSCVRMGIAEEVSLDNFMQNSRQYVEDTNGELKDLQAEQMNMQKIPNHGEFWLSHKLQTFV
jgi:UDP-N-acetylglucosamine:LPS N-acetylglucosamine transferase